MSRWRRAFRFRIRRSDVDREVEDELDFHIERTTQRLVGEGWSPEEAEREARARFGDRDRHGHHVRRIAHRRLRMARTLEGIRSLGRDARLGARSLLRRPAFSGSTVLVLALGIAAATTVFSFARAVLLRPLPYPDPDALVRIRETRTPPSPGMLDRRNLTLPDVGRLRERATRLSGVAGFMVSSVACSDPMGARRLPTGSVDRHLFGLLGTAPILGRAFTEDDVLEGAEPVALIGYRLWIERFGGRADVLGRTLELNYTRHRIVGVMPAGFDFPDGAEAWRPLLPSVFTERFHVVQAMGRLAPGATLEAAEEELATLVRGWTETEPDLHGEATGATARGWHAQLVADVRPAMLLLAGAVALLILLVCVNVGGLLTARALEREREVAVRRSLGASSMRLVGPVLSESLLLAGAGGALGFLLSKATLGWVIALSPADLPARELVTADGRVALFTTAIALGIGLISGLVPALRSIRVETPAALKSGATGSVGGGGSGVKGGALIAVEVGMATLLLVGGALLLHSFVRMLEIDTGVRRLEVLTASISLPADYEDADRGFGFFERLRRRAEALPAVSATAVSLFAPLNGSLPIAGVHVPGEAPADEERGQVRVLSVTPEYFRVVGIPVVGGRAFRRSDDGSAPRVAVVSRAAARRFFGERDPVGLTLLIDDENARRMHGAGEVRIVGVAADVRQEGALESPPALLYVPYEQYIEWGGGTLLVASEGDAASLIPAIRDMLRDLDPRIPIDRIETIAQGLSGSVAQPRFFTVLVVGFALLASLVALVGLYGILAYDVRRRLSELGIRAVLGARPRDNVALLARRGAFYVGVGVAGGLLAAISLTGWLESLLYGIEPNDPPTLAGAALVMFAVGIAASLIPSAHAMRADPGAAIRAE